MDALLSPDAVPPEAVMLDATLLDPALGRDARAEFTAGHPPGARHLDLASLRDTADPLPNMLPDGAALAARLATLGVSDGQPIVLYDDSPWKTAARAWWMLHAAGWDQVAILDGGLARWRAEGRPLETGDAAPPAGHVAPRAIEGAVPKREVGGAGQLVDARSAARFTGEEADPRPGIAPGHIPGSRSLPYSKLFEADGRWKRGPALRAAFAEAGVDPEQPITVTCGSGITACVVAFGQYLLGGPAARLYDGSWSEWGADPGTRKATGPA